MEEFKMEKDDKRLLPQTLLSHALLLLVTGTAQAALPPDAILDFDPGLPACLAGGTYPDCNFGEIDVPVGSYFAFDVNADGTFAANEKIAIVKNEGVRLGEIQPASGSHSGIPDGSELASIDMPWSFFANTGMHQSILPVAISNGDDGAGDNTASLDYSGWGITWNGIGNIPLGGDSANFPSDTGVAVVNCSSGCNTGDTFSLDYFAHVPVADPSGFGGVAYTVHLEGTVEPGTPLPPSRDVTIEITGGDSHECTEFGGSPVEVTADIVTTDMNDILAVNWELDGMPAGSGDTTDIFTSLGEHTVAVNVETLASGSLQDSTQLTVVDTTAPDLDIHFVDQRSGEKITSVTNEGEQFIVVQYEVSDVCDQTPLATGVASPVYVVNDGDTLTIKVKKMATTTLDATAINVTAEATDASGNRRNRNAQLLIGD